MSRILLLSFVCLFTSCKVFNINKAFNTRDLENVIVYANAHPTLKNTGFKNIKLKTKINILIDSILVSTTPFFGIDLGQITITNGQIKIRQKLKNKTECLKFIFFIY